MSARPDTGRTIHAAPSTAAFVRAQVANGVSVETLRRRLGIRPEHMVGMLEGVEPAPIAKADLSATQCFRPLAKPKSAPAQVRIAKPPTSGGLSRVEIIRRAQEDRAQAYRLAQMVIPVVVAVTGFDRRRIENSDKSGAAVNIRSMVFTLMHEMVPACPLNAIAWVIDKRQAVVVERALVRCARLRETSTEFNAWYLRALTRLAP